MSARTLLFAFLALAGMLRAQPAGSSPASATPAPAPDLAKNPAPALSPLNPELPTLFIAGDSTAAQGWAAPFASYFDTSKINIANRSRGGRSTRTFITLGEWDTIMADLKSGDVVLIQFGHNDGGTINDQPGPSARSRGSLPGLGEESQEIDNLLTGKHEIVHTFGWYMRKMISDVQSKGAKPIVVGLTVRKIWNNGRIERGPGSYSGWSYEVAKDAKVPFIDLTNTIADKWEALGQEKVNTFYPRDHTHFNPEAADLYASTIVSLLKGLRPNPIDKVLSEKGAAVPAEGIAWLRLPFPIDPKLPTLFLAGDSTVRNGNGDGSNGQWGWGDSIGRYFDLSKINVVNRAVGGTGVQSFISTGHWPRLLSMVKPGDFVMIQFGHNDNGSRGPLPGIGEETAERQNPKTNEKYVLHTWGWYLRQEIADVRARGATPIICSLVPRKIWKDGKIARSKDTHAGWAQQVAASEKVPFLDLNERIAERYDALGENKVNALFADEHTHTSGAGAELNAEVVAAALVALPDNPLASYMKSAGAK